MSVLQKYHLPVPAHRPAPVYNGCGQGCIKMVIHHFEQTDLPDAELSAICGVKKDGAASLAFDMAMGMSQRGYETIRIADITPEAYLEDPAAYMRAAGFDPKDNPDIIEMRKSSVSRYIAHRNQGLIEDRPTAPTAQDMAALIAQGYALISWVNSQAICGNFDKVTGHFVVPIDVSDSRIIFHDPGSISPIYERAYGVAVSVVHELFLSYMRYPDVIGINPETGKPPMMGILAFRPKIKI